MAEGTENFENEGGSLGPEGSSGGPAGGASSEQEWTGPSREDWESLQENNRKLQDSLEGLTNVFAEAPTQRGPQEQFDLSQLDMTDPYQAAWLMDQIVQERMGGITPYVKNAAQDQGQRQMVELLKQHETSLKKDYPDGFDPKLAERAAFAFFDETGDAEGSVGMAAKYAAEVRKEERNAAIEGYRKANSRNTLFDFEAGGNDGIRAAEPAKSYDEVLDKWASQTEV